MGVVIEICVKHPGGRTRNRGTEIIRQRQSRARLATCALDSTARSNRVLDSAARSNHSRVDLDPRSYRHRLLYRMPAPLIAP
jgi:hypothetical protein